MRKRVLSVGIALLLVCVCMLTACVSDVAVSEGTAETAEAKTMAPEDTVAETGQAQESASAEEQERLTITYVVPNIAHPTFLVAKEAFEQAAEDLNFEPVFTGSSSFDVNEMVKAIELAIASEADGIVVMASVPNALQPVIQQASDAGIPVVTVIADCADADRLAYLGLNNYNYGQIATAEALKALDGEKPVVACMVPTFENTSGIEIIESEKEALAANGDYEWVTTVESKTDMVNAVSLWEDVLTTYPDVNLIFCVSSEAGPAAATVMKERGLTSEDITVIAISDLEETLDYIREGLIHATMSENIPRIGYQPCQWICDYIRNGERPELINDTGTFAITIDNVDNYKEIENDKSLWK